MDAFVRAWIDLLLRGGGEASGPVRLRTGRTGHLARAGLEAGGGWAIRRGSVEQSNTSIRIGDGAILKVIRKLENGVHPELEVGRFLTETAGFAATPSLLGWTELDSAALGHGAVTLSILQAFVPNEGDGWSWVLERLARGAEPGEAGTEALDEAMSWLRRLGRRTAEMHVAFETDTDDPAFRPEPVGTNDIRSWVCGRRRQPPAARSTVLPTQQGSSRRPEASPRRFSLAATRWLSGCRQCSARSRPSRRRGTTGITISAKYWSTGQDAVIIDFEGEPLRPLGGAPRKACSAAGRRRHAPLARLRRRSGEPRIAAGSARGGTGRR